MLPRRRAAAALTAVLAVAVCACGGSAGTSSSSLPRFVARANAMCQSTGQRVQALGPAPRFSQVTPANLAAAHEYLGRLIPLLSDLSTQLRSIADTGAPIAQAEPVLGKLDGVIAGFRTAVTAAATGDADGFRTGFGGAVRADEEASAIDEQLGLTLCEQVATQGFRLAGTGTPSPAG